MEKDNVRYVLELLISELKVSVPDQSICDELQKHPNANSLLAISDILNKWSIPNSAYALELGDLLISELPPAFIAYLKSEQGEFVLVNHIDNEHVVISNEKYSKLSLTIGDFEKIYGSSILLAAQNSDSDEDKYDFEQLKGKFQTLGLVFFICCLIIIGGTHFTSSIFYLRPINYSLLFILFFKTIGLLITVFLSIESIATSNSLVGRICKLSNTNCNAILSSGAAKITENLSWSEVGFLYFAGTWLALFLNSTNTGLITFLAFINLPCLIYSFYSIYYQGVIAKEWCVLCCVVQALFWVEFILFIPYLGNGIRFSDSSAGYRFVINLLIAFGVPVLIRQFFKPHLLLLKEIETLRSRYNKFKYNTTVFDKMLSEEVRYQVLDDDLSIIIGNTEAPQTITLVSNPFCRPCGIAHKVLTTWIESREDIKLQLLFAIDINKNDLKNKVAAHLISLGFSQDDKLLKNALAEWFNGRYDNYDLLYEKYPISINPEAGRILQQQSAWCNLTSIKYTPAIFINGRRLPAPYEIEDLLYLV